MNSPKVITGDKSDNIYSPKHSIAFILDRLRSAHNVGNIFRIAELVQINEVITCGYTATPPHHKLEKTARGCEQLVPFRHFETSADAILTLKDEGYTIVAVETVESAPLFWQYDIPQKTAFVLGNEALGVSEEALKLCDDFIRLPVFGFKNSLNVGNCASVIAYEAVRQFSSQK